jgi:hypothetical protein
MMLPTPEDYIQGLHTLMDDFQSHHPPETISGCPYTYSQRLLLVFFLLMHLRHITAFKAQRRWLHTHPQAAQQLGFDTLPDRTTLSRRYRALAPLLEQLVAHVAHWAAPLLVEAEAIEPLARPIVEDKSLFKAHGPVWHQRQRQAGVIPANLRSLDTDATWCKSDYHGWVYGYGLHLTVEQHGFALLAQVETAAVSETQVIEVKYPALRQLAPTEVVADDAYTCTQRAQDWAQQGMCLLTTGKRLGRKGHKGAYRRFIRQPENQALLHSRRTTIEPIFDLVGKLSGVGDQQKQLPVCGQERVRPFLLLGVLAVQLAMILNCIWHQPLRNISHMMAVLS